MEDGLRTSKTGGPPSEQSCCRSRVSRGHDGVNLCKVWRQLKEAYDASSPQVELPCKACTLLLPEWRGTLELPGAPAALSGMLEGGEFPSSAQLRSAEAVAPVDSARLPRDTLCGAGLGPCALGRFAVCRQSCFAVGLPEGLLRASPRAWENILVFLPGTRARGIQSE